MTTEAVVYWIRKAEHSDPYSEGYIGITHNFNDRMSRHKTGNGKPRDTPVQRAILKYGWDNLVRDILLSSSLNKCSELEYELRPERCIGWNIAKGGWQSNRMFGKDNPMYGSIAYNRIPVTIDGIEYESRLAAGNALGISSATVDQWVATGRTKRTERDVSGRLVTIDGVEYTSIRAAARAMNIPYTTLRHRLLIQD